MTVATQPDVRKQARLLRACRRHPVLFAEQFLQRTLTAEQRIMLKAIGDHKRVHVRSGHSLGKSYALALAVLWFGCTRSPCRIITTASVMRQVRRQLWGEIATVWRECRDAGIPLPGVMLKSAKWEISNRSSAEGFTAEHTDRFTGEHAPHILFVLDEGQGVSEDIIDGVESSMQGEGAKLVIAGNPIRPSGVFWQTCRSELYHNVKLSAANHPNIIQGREVVRGCMTREWIAEIEQEHGKESPFYLARVLGEFPTDDTYGLFPFSHVDAAQERHLSLPRGKGAPGACPALRPRLGVDVARFGDDQTCLLVRNDVAVVHIERHSGKPTTWTTQRTLALMREWHVPPDDVSVDVIGLGAGVVDQLKHRGLRVQGVNFGAKSILKGVKGEALYANVRAECYKRAADALDPARGGDLALLDDGLLAEELAAIKYEYDERSGALKIKPKDDIKKGLGRSPDTSDAFALTFPPARGLRGFAGAFPG